MFVGEFREYPEHWQTFHDDEFYWYLLGFKWLEPSLVTLCVIGFKDMARPPEHLYVGLSRARCLLVIDGDPELIADADGLELG